MRVRRLLDRVVQGQAHGRELLGEPVQLERAHAVLAGDGAARGEGGVDDLGEGRARRSWQLSAPGGVMMSGWSFPSPAWPMLAISTLWAAAICSIRPSTSRTLALGTQTFHVLPVVHGPEAVAEACQESTSLRWFVHES